jgi:hypothetical protein
MPHLGRLIHRFVIRPATLFVTRALDARRNPQRPPMLAVAFPCDEGRTHYSTDVTYAAMIALAEGRPILPLVTVSPLHWHRETYAVPASAWRPWRTLTTGDFLKRVQRAGGRIGTYHTSGVAALVRQGYMETEAHVLVGGATR